MAYKGFWKFNNSLLKDKEYSKIVKDSINEVLSLHVKETNNNSHNNNNNNDDNNNNNNNNKNNNKNDYENKEFIINDQILLETMLMMIRGKQLNIVHIGKESRLKKKNNWKKTS